MGALNVGDMGSAQFAPANGLLNNLIAYWPGNEASGNLLDAHTNGLDLTDVNTVTNNPGLVYATARQYTRASNEYHAINDNALLSLGADSDYTLAAWVRHDSMPGIGVIHFIATKRGSAATTIEYAIYLYESGGVDYFRTYVSNGAAGAGVSATTLGQPVIDTWYLVLVWHDATANTLNIQADNGTVDSVAWAGGTQDAGASFGIGGVAYTATAMDGRIGPTAFWKSAAGAGGVLDATKRTALYNAGAGLQYDQFTS